MLSPKHSSFVVRGKATAAKGENHLRPNAAPPGGDRGSGRGCRAFALKGGLGGRQGRPRPGASIQEACARNPVSNLGHLKQVFRAWNSAQNVWISANVWQCRGFPPQNKVGINDHNVTCQFCAEKGWCYLERERKSPDSHFQAFKALMVHCFEFRVWQVWWTPAFEAGGVCVIKLLALSGHVSMNHLRSKYIILDRMPLTSPGPKLKWNGLSCMSADGRPRCW